MSAAFLKIQAILGRFRSDEEGSTAIEYALIAIVISVAIIPAILNYKTALLQKFEYIGAAVNSAL